jgi:Mg-chelatase subunit ChlD
MPAANHTTWEVFAMRHVTRWSVLFLLATWPYLAAGPIRPAGAAAVTVGPRPAMVPAGEQPAPGCTATRDKTAAPAVIPLGQTVTVTLKVTGSCPEREEKADVVMVIDRSGSMAGQKLQAAKDAAVAFVDGTDPMLVRISVVAVSSVATEVQGLTEDHAALRAAIQGLLNERGTNLVDGLDTARKVLISAAVRPDAAKVIVFLTDGRHAVRTPTRADMDPVIAAVRGAGIEVFAIGLGTDVDASLLRRMATDAAHYYFSPSTNELRDIYLSIAGRVRAQVLLSYARLVDELPANMVYVAGTAQPSEPQVSADGRTLTWELSDVREPGFELSYQVRPTQVGVWPTNTRASMDYVDGWGIQGQLVFPIPTVQVIDAPPQRAGCVCRIVYDRVPQHVIDDALAHPERYYGWQYLLDPGKPAGPMNPPRECLTLMNVNIDYHPLWNTPEWRVGCP